MAFAPREHGRPLGLTEVDLLVRLGERDRAEQVVRTHLDALLAASRDEPAPEDPNRRLYLPVAYAWLLPSLDLLGLSLPPEHQHAVRTCLDEARAHPDVLALPASGPAADLLRDLERRLGAQLGPSAGGDRPPGRT